jgi:hypothetical protein
VILTLFSIYAVRLAESVLWGFWRFVFNPLEVAAKKPVAWGTFFLEKETFA